MCNTIIELYEKDNFYEIKKVNPILLKFIKHISNKKALDIGCGIGMNAYFLQKQGYDVLGIDINSEAVSLANKLGVRAINKDIRKYYWNTKFDIITSFYMLQHLSKQDAVNIIKKMVNNINLDGIVIIAIFVEHEDRINNVDISSILGNQLTLMHENTWQRVDTEHGQPHEHKGYYCIYKKGNNK